jgi:hypothetical protein
MKTIVITDPCYTDGGKEDINGLRGGGSVILEVTDEFFEVLKQPPIVEYNKKDNWDGGTYFFGGKFNIDEYDYVDDHFNDAGMTCIADYDKLEAFDWSDFCSTMHTVANNAALNDHGHFLMSGSTFLGDVGASVWVKRENGEIIALAIDVVGYTFGDEYEDS